MSSDKYVQTFRTDLKLILEVIIFRKKAEVPSGTSLYVYRSTELRPESSLNFVISDQCLGQGM